MKAAVSKAAVSFVLAIGLLLLAPLGIGVDKANAAVVCVTAGPNPDLLPVCGVTGTSAANALAAQAAALFAYKVNENAITKFNVPVVAGDIVICDSILVACDATHPKNWGDVLRFRSTGAHKGTGTLFSDANEIGPVGPFDINLARLHLQHLRLFKIELGVEGLNGIIYNNGDSIGAIISDVPELSTWAMMIVGFGLTGLRLRRRNRVISVTT
jgi:hypothetical protein